MSTRTELLFTTGTVQYIKMSCLVTHCVVFRRAKPGNCKMLGLDDMLLLDSGAQYLDGTTGVYNKGHYFISNFKAVQSFSILQT